jgi:hypothetical protein
MSVTTHPKSQANPVRGGGRPLARRIQARAQLETAVRHGFRVIRWHLEEPEEAES